MSEEKKKRKTKITFKQVSETEIEIHQLGKKIGHIWSETERGTLPYPHEDDKEYCKNSIQICGFASMRGPWACGVFTGTRDIVVDFVPADSRYIEELKIQYRNYLSAQLAANAPATEIQNFSDWSKVGMHVPAERKHHPDKE